jgi:hypothetical protein
MDVDVTNPATYEPGTAYTREVFAWDINGTEAPYVGGLPLLGSIEPVAASGVPAGASVTYVNTYR